MRTRPRRLRAAVLSAAVLTALSACGSDLGPELHPGAAAVVEGETVSLDQVDEFTDDYCALFATVLEERGDVVPLGQMRTFVLSTLIEDELLHRFAEEQGLEPGDGYRERLAGLEGQAEQLGVPEEHRSVFLELSRREAYAQAIKVAAGTEALESAGLEVTPEAALERGTRIYTEWREQQDVTVDPRFGVMDPGLTTMSGQRSLSVAVSELARQADIESPDPSYVQGLPASQTCG